MILAMIAVILALAVLLLAVSFDHDSPTDVYRKYVDESNDRDIRRMFDQTATKFTPDYEERLENLSAVIFLFDPQIEILSLGVVYEANMSDMERLAAEIVIDDVESKLSVEVDDYCYVHYSVSIHYLEIDQTASFTGQVLCVSIDGDWYLAVPGFY